VVHRSRRGRPPGQLPPANHPVTRRIRELVAEVHQGNLREAALHAGVPYPTLRELHRGETANPGLATVRRLASAYGVPIEWFLEVGDAGVRPRMGWTGILPPDTETGSDPKYARRVVIPFAAGSLFSLALRLERELEALPPSPSRPIVGGASDPLEFRRRLTAFLLQPLLAARGAGASIPLPTEPPIKGEPDLTPERREVWLGVLRRLGEYWQAALTGVL
jgi:transcriptional regulator with XRE-family HTH domain